MSIRANTARTGKNKLFTILFFLGIAQAFPNFNINRILAAVISQCKSTNWQYTLHSITELCVGQTEKCVAQQISFVCAKILSLPRTLQTFQSGCGAYRIGYSRYSAAQSLHVNSVQH